MIPCLTRDQFVSVRGLSPAAKGINLHGTPDNQLIDADRDCRGGKGD